MQAFVNFTENQASSRNRKKDQESLIISTHDYPDDYFCPHKKGTASTKSRATSVYFLGKLDTIVSSIRFLRFGGFHASQRLPINQLAMSFV
jgi:hypothetical protein